jgi:hypothetical protein
MFTSSHATKETTGLRHEPIPTIGKMTVCYTAKGLGSIENASRPHDQQPSEEVLGAKYACTLRLKLSAGLARLLEPHPCITIRMIRAFCFTYKPTFGPVGPIERE